MQIPSFLISFKNKNRLSSFKKKTRVQWVPQNVVTDETILPIIIMKRYDLKTLTHKLQIFTIIGKTTFIYNLTLCLRV